MSLKLGLVGAGNWGENLIRNFLQLGVLSVVCDNSEIALKKISKKYPTVKLTQNFEDILSDSSIDAIVISAPTRFHEDLAKKSLSAKKHVYVEKPLARRKEGATELMQMADELNLILMVGHLLLYHPAVNKLKELIEQDVLGEIRFLNSDRRNFSSVRGDTNVIWDLAPHDISMISYILGESEVRLSQGRGFSTKNDGVVDIAHLDLVFGEKIFAHVHNSWIDPQKQSLLTVNGTKKTAVINDTRQDGKLELYSLHPVDNQVIVERPFYLSEEPLRLECQHFLDCVINKQKPLSDAMGGYQVVKILEEAEQEIKEHLEIIKNNI